MGLTYWFIVVNILWVHYFVWVGSQKCVAESPEDESEPKSPNPKEKQISTITTRTITTRSLEETVNLLENVEGPE